MCNPVLVTMVYSARNQARTQPTPTTFLRRIAMIINLLRTVRKTGPAPEKRWGTGWIGGTGLLALLALIALLGCEAAPTPGPATPTALPGRGGTGVAGPSPAASSSPPAPALPAPTATPVLAPT